MCQFTLFSFTFFLYSIPVASFQILSAQEIDSVRTGGDILRRCLQATSEQVRPGITTLELDTFAEAFIRDHQGARPAFKGFHGFPGTLCTSVNEQCVHGLPGPRVLQEGDIIALDCGVIYGELYTDACVTVPVGRVRPEVQKFLRVSADCLEAAVEILRPGVRVGDVSALIEKYLRNRGYTAMRGLTGHGLGATLHQFPDIPNQGKAGTGPLLPPHTIIAIEPITSMGTDQIKDEGDGWTIATADGSWSAHFEHTILITETGHEILA